MFIRNTVPRRTFTYSVCEIDDKEYGEVEKVTGAGVFSFRSDDL